MDLDALDRQMIAWRRDLHAHPEFGMEERRTSAFVAATLRSLGVDDVVEGVGGTGVVATIRRGTGNRAIALRADMDALRIAESGDRPWRSTTPGTMHACGHDGHTAMLLGAARILGDARSFRPEVSAEIERQMRIVARGTAETYNLDAVVTYTREFVPLVNDPAMTDEALAVARDVFGADRAGVRPEPWTASEDFAQFLRRVPGCFALVGNGTDSLPLHNAGYDFNDAGLVPGARYFAALCERRLPVP